MTDTRQTATLLIKCKDQKGLVHRISDFVFRHEGNILHADQHIDFETGLFLSRVEWDLEGFALPKGEVARAFKPLMRPGSSIITITYYGQRMVTANKAINKPEDMKGMKLRVPPAPLFLMFTKSVGANATPIAFAEVYLALQQKTVDGQENPLPTIMAKKFYEVQTHVMLTGHITESLLTIVGTHVWAKLSDAEKKIFSDVLSEAALKATNQIRASEQKTADELRKLGKTVIEPDRAAFRAAALPLHNDGSGGWSKAEYDALQALK